MRVLALLLVAGCTINGRGPDPVTARPPADPDRMPADVLAKQDPSADTSKNPVLSRSEAHYRDPNGPAEGLGQLLGCMKMFSCSTRGGDSDLGGLLVVAAALAATRRRKGATRNRS